jgi:hypothetical protein
MNSPFRHLFAAAVFSAALLTIGGLVGSPSGTASRPAATFSGPDRLPSLPPRATYRPAEGDRQSIEAALAAHGNRQNIVPTFFTDLIRTMERTGLPRDLARDVAVTLARNPKLDELAGMTIAGCFQAYLAATGDDPDTALADLISFVQYPAQHARRADPKHEILAPETAAQIDEKMRSGKHAAAELIMERALLARFNPSLAARILVP